LPKPIALLQDICAVPGTDVPLVFARDGSARSDEGHRFRAIRGVPILREEIPPPIVKPRDHVSQGICQERIDFMCALSGYTLMLGAGNSPFSHPDVVDVEFDLYANTDVIADGHRLPFRSGTFDLFFAMNVFEHLREPPVAARETLRVLKPGGEVLIHTAFLQPLHEEPAHFYNATEYGVREWFRDFESVECTVSWNFNPLYSLSWLSDETLRVLQTHLGAEAAERIGDLRLSEVAGFWQQPTGWRPEVVELFFKLPEASQRRVAAGFELCARKPTD